MSTLTEFLLARIAEDQAELGVLQTRDESAGPNGVGWAEVGAISEVLMVSHTRALAECEAKRRIVALQGGAWERAKKDAPEHSRGRDGDGDDSGDFIRVGYTVLRGAEAQAFRDEWYELSPPNETMKAVAAVYADHPDYEQEWRP